MRTTVNIPDNLLNELIRYSHTQKTTEAVNLAIKDWIRLKKIQEIKKLRGKLDIADNLEELKKAEFKKLRKLNE